MKRTNRAALHRIVTAWEQVLVQARHLAVQTDDAEIRDALPGIELYIIGQLETYRARLKIRPENARFAGRENRPDNAATTGTENDR